MPKGRYYQNGVYRTGRGDPEIVEASRDGNIDCVRKIVEDAIRDPRNNDNDIARCINQSKRWEEIQDKWGTYDKVWQWNADTALISASRAGHRQIVRYLLMHGADPTLEACPNEDTHVDATKVASDNCIKAMLAAALVFWQKASYADAASDRNRYPMNNKPNDQSSLSASVENAYKMSMALDEDRKEVTKRSRDSSSGDPNKRQRVDDFPDFSDEEKYESKRPPAKRRPLPKKTKRCQVCIRAKKGGCGTEKAVYRCLRRPGGPLVATAVTTSATESR
mmetsp:Transcript_18740/g.26385  ORF Transcript_18740/g.26385 Transcript_18740/m.26385 type:complete len:278 (-) Transcript_18740:117-950(-)